MSHKQLKSQYPCVCVVCQGEDGWMEITSHTDSDRYVNQTQPEIDD